MPRPAADDVVPAFGDAFAPPPVPTPEVRASVPPVSAPEPAAVASPELVAMRAELERLRGENAALKAATPAAPLAGKWYQVSLKNGPKAIVQLQAGEHPFDAYKRKTGVISSIDPIESSEVPAPVDGREKILLPS
jgi:hypothetical protein